jgi:hypothetical protein
MRDRGPDFLGIGATRGGTGWLTKNLRGHPGLWITPIKELHYFDEQQVNPGLSLGPRVRGDHPLSRYWRRCLRAETRRVARRRRLGRAAWSLRFLFFTHSDADYRRLFAPAGDRVAGEVTPAYGTLTPAVIDRVREMFPALKLILLMRNPVERAWSHCRMRLAELQGRPFAAVPHEEIVAFLDGDAARAASDYPAIVDAWSRSFPAEQIHLEWFDRVVEDPQGLLRDVYEFLGVPTTDPRAYLDASRRIHVGVGPSEVPQPYRDHLARRFLGLIEETHRRYGSYAARWLAYAREHA